MLTAAAFTCGALAFGALVQFGGARLRWSLHFYVGLELALMLWALGDPLGLERRDPWGSGVIGYTLRECARAAARLLVAFELGRVEQRLRASSQPLMLVGLLMLGGAVTSAHVIQAGPRSTFRELAFAASGAGVLLLSTRLVAAYHFIALGPVERAASTGLGSYLILHGALLGAATEASWLGAKVGARVSTVAWSAWALWLALSAWAGTTRPEGT